jgi:hypothetical protein
MPLTESFQVRVDLFFKSKNTALKTSPRSIPLVPCGKSSLFVFSTWAAVAIVIPYERRNVLAPSAQAWLSPGLIFEELHA